MTVYSTDPCGYPSVASGRKEGEADLTDVDTKTIVVVLVIWNANDDWFVEVFGDRLTIRVVKLEAVSDVDAYKPGSYSVTFNLSDAAGNDATEIVRTVNIVDTTEPKLTLKGDPDIIHEASTNYTDPGATATDLVDGVLSANIQVTNTVDVSKS